METGKRNLATAILASVALGGFGFGDYEYERQRPYKRHSTASKPHRNRSKHGLKRRKLNNIAKRSRAINRG